MLKSWQPAALNMTALRCIDLLKRRIRKLSCRFQFPFAFALDGPNLSIPSPCFGQTRLELWGGAEVSST
jgi:hypothetical protein